MTQEFLGVKDLYLGDNQRVLIQPVNSGFQVFGATQARSLVSLKNQAQKQIPEQKRSS